MSVSDAEIISDKSAEAIKLDRLLDQARKLLDNMLAANRLNGLQADGTCPVFFEDEVFYITLPWAAFDTLQMKILAAHAPIDNVFLRQLFDLVPTLAGRNFIDAGSFTGCQALIIDRFLKPDQTHLFEPQKTMYAALKNTISVNDLEKTVHLHMDIIDEDDTVITLGAQRSHSLSETRFLRREGGSLRGKSIDELNISSVGLMNLDFNNSKIYALRGARKTIEADRPVIAVDLSGRDATEIKEFLEEFEYEHIRAGRHSMIFLPK